MRRRLLVVPALVVLAMPEQAAAEATGGIAPPTSTGGAQYGQVPEAARQPAPLVVRAFGVTPSTIRAGAPARFSFRVDGGASRVRVSIQILRRGTSVPVGTLVLLRRTRRTYTRSIRLRPDSAGPGRYVAVLQVADSSQGRRLLATPAAARAALRVVAPPAPAPAPSPTAAEPRPAPVGGGVFPVRGPYSFGSEDARFAADRGGRLHRGQDITAAAGTPLAAPRPGVVYWRAYQRDGAGHYLVIRGSDGRDYVFMHLRAASPLAPGTPVAAGTLIGEVGSSGSSSGPHLHFEIWPGGWYASPASQPIDPLPELRSWEGR